MMITTPATPAQTSFLRDLFAKRVVPADLAGTDLAALTKQEASMLITRLKTAPYTPTAPAAGTPNLLAGVRKASYALLADPIALALTGWDLGKNDLVFVEVKEYKGTRYMRRLTGNAGGFLRTRLNSNDTKVIVDAILADPDAAILRFSKHYEMCAKCHAELTDPTSRAIGLGPTCRKSS